MAASFRVLADAASARRIGSVESLLGQPLLAHGAQRRVRGVLVLRPGARGDEHGDTGADPSPQHGHGINHEERPRRHCPLLLPGAGSSSHHRGGRRGVQRLTPHNQHGAGRQQGDGNERDPCPGRRDARGGAGDTDERDEEGVHCRLFSTDDLTPRRRQSGFRPPAQRETPVDRARRPAKTCWVLYACTGCARQNTRMRRRGPQFMVNSPRGAGRDIMEYESQRTVRG